MENSKESVVNKKHIKAFLLILLIIFIIALSILMAVVLAVLKKAPETKLDNLYSSFNQTSSIYDQSGELLEEIESLEFRTIVPISTIPDDLKNAFISIEDERFYQHKGIDPRSIAGSLLTNIESNYIVRGASTITQQLVRNVYLNDEKSLDRKINEAYLALRVEENLTKDEILEAYLNRINLGQGAYGVQGAAQTYFSKDVSELSLAQCALLAGIVKSPTQYQPFLRLPKEEYSGSQEDIFAELPVNGQDMYIIFNPKSLERQEIVLNKMKELDYISAEEHETALNEDIESELKPLVKKQHNMSSYSMDFIKSNAGEVLSEYYNISLEEAEHNLFTGGYKIYTSIDETLQKEIEDVYLDFTSFINSESSASEGAKMLNFTVNSHNNIVDENDNVIYYHIGNLFNENGDIVLGQGTYELLSNGDLLVKNNFMYLLEDQIFISPCYSINDQNNLITYNVGRLNIDASSFLVNDEDITIKENFLNNNPEFYTIADNMLIINKEFLDADLTPITQPQSSAIIIDNNQGYVKAVIGGLDIDSRNSKLYNRVKDSVRQPGSALQPFTVYLPALESGMTMGTVIDDVPMKVDDIWWPENYYSGFKGLLTTRNSLLENSSVVPAKILQNMGFDHSLDILSRVGLFDSDNPNEDFIVSPDENPERNDFTLDALALGNLVKGVSNLNLSAAYMTIANEGNYIEPTAIVKIEDSSGNVIIDNGLNREFKQVYSSENAYLIKDALKQNAVSGNSRGASLPGRSVSVNLGVNKFNSDLWLMGFTENYTIGTWIGCDTPKISLNTENNVSVKLWNDIAETAHANIDTGEEASKPQTIVEKYICAKSGKLASKNCEYAKDAYTEQFISGTEPTEYCDQHHSRIICSTTGLLFSRYCPDNNMVNKNYFVRDEHYDVHEHNEIYPQDYETMPTGYCTTHTRAWFNQKIEEQEAREERRRREAERREAEDDDDDDGNNNSGSDNNENSENN